MYEHPHLLFILCAVLSILFLLWVLVQITSQRNAPRKAARRAQRDSRYLRVISRAPRSDTSHYGFATPSGVSASSPEPSTSTAEPAARSKDIPA